MNFVTFYDQVKLLMECNMTQAERDLLKALSIKILLLQNVN